MVLVPPIILPIVAVLDIILSTVTSAACRTPVTFRPSLAVSRLATVNVPVDCMFAAVSSPVVIIPPGAVSPPVAVVSPDVVRVVHDMLVPWIGPGDAGV